MRDEVKGIITIKCASAHRRVLEFDFIRGGGRLWVGPQHRSEITNIDTPSGLLTSYLLQECINQNNVLDTTLK